MSSVNLRSGNLRSSSYDSDTDPMAGVANLADVMLVFACGLMMALITYWNVDVSSVTEVLKQDQVSEIQNPEDITDQLKSTDGNSYIDMGKVYMDPATGKYYMLSESDGTASSSTSAGTASSGTAASAGATETERSAGAD